MVLRVVFHAYPFKCSHFLVAAIRWNLEEAGKGMQPNSALVRSFATFRFRFTPRYCLLKLSLSCLSFFSWSSVDKTNQNEIEMNYKLWYCLAPWQVDYPEIVDGVQPRHRFMSAYEQHVEPPDKSWQYLLFAAEPYETISFKVPSREIDKSDGKFFTDWNKETKQVRNLQRWSCDSCQWENLW